MKILDCTLRDGGYYNNWEFDKNLIKEYLKVMDGIKVDYVEIGFRFLDKIRTKGQCAYSDESFLKSLKIPKNLKIGIMINASDFVSSKDIISFTTMEEFKEKLQAIELGVIETVAQLASYVNNIEPVSLPTVDNTTIFTRSDYVDSLIAKFLGGTGTYGAITLSDMIGSLGGVKVSEFATQYRTAMTALHAAGELTALATHLDQLNLGLKGDFTSGSDPNFTITDPDGPNVGPDANPYPDFQEQKIAQIEADCANLMGRRNVNPDIQTAIDAWNNIFKQIFNEKDFKFFVSTNFTTRAHYCFLNDVYITF